jgi:hypothetical protein
VCKNLVFSETILEIYLFFAPTHNFRTIFCLRNEDSKHNSYVDSALNFFSQTSNNDSSEKKRSNGKKSKNLDISTKEKLTDQNLGPEVFLGGSCNPTTWRADVAIPALTELGISFYNPVRIIHS